MPKEFHVGKGLVQPDLIHRQHLLYDGNRRDRKGSRSSGDDAFHPSAFRTGAQYGGRAVFLTLWKHADPDFPTVRQAHAEYENLH